MHVYGFFGIILGYIVFKECKLSDPKLKILAIINMLVPKTPKDIQVFNGVA